MRVRDLSNIILNPDRTGSATPGLSIDGVGFTPPDSASDGRTAGEASRMLPWTRGPVPCAIPSALGDRSPYRSSGGLRGLPSRAAPRGPVAPALDAAWPVTGDAGVDAHRLSGDAGADALRVRDRAPVGSSHHGESGGLHGDDGCVSWSVAEPSGGTIDGSGVYTAPSQPGTYHVVASAAGARVSATVTVVPSGLDLVAGMPGALGSADGVQGTARFNGLTGVWYDGATTLYTADAWNYAIRQTVAATGQVSTVAGTASSTLLLDGGGCADGVGPAAQFVWPWGVLGDGQGNLYVADKGCRTIRRIVLGTGLVTTIAGQPGGGAQPVDGTGSGARFNGPAGLAWASPDVLYVGDGLSVRTGRPRDGRRRHLSRARAPPSRTAATSRTTGRALST